jgi:hypothetical protein
MSARTRLSSLYRTAIPALLGLAMMTLPTSASAQTTTAKKYGGDVSGWTIEAYSTDGQYVRCGAIVPGATATAKVSFEKSSEGWTVVVPIKATGDEMKGVLEIDAQSARGSFYRRDDGRIMTFLKEPQIKRLRDAKSMTVTVGTEKTAIPLAGIDAALRKTNECNDKGGA